MVKNSHEFCDEWCNEPGLTGLLRQAVEPLCPKPTAPPSIGAGEFTTAIEHVFGRFVPAAFDGKAVALGTRYSGRHQSLGFVLKVSRGP